MTYNTGAKKKDKYCTTCFSKVEGTSCPVCAEYVPECESLTKEEVKRLRSK